MADRKNRMAATSVFLGTLAACLALMSSCSGDDESGVAGTSAALVPTSAPGATTTVTTHASSTTPGPTAPSSTLGTAEPRSATPLEPAPGTFVSAIEPLDPVVTARVAGRSWNPGCPLALDELRYVEVTHLGDDGESIGELIVNEQVADDVVDVFAALYDAGFPVASMRLVDDFDADDLRSMQANNTSAFNCRFVEGTTRWSWHAFGLAIDVNPLVNPYVTPAGVSPPEGEIYADRALGTAGMIVDGDAATTAFADIGWEWGGSWTSGQDYQHFAFTDG